ncbi:MAG: tyrosine-protein phosphatase [Congregibacter sp.]
MPDDAAATAQLFLRDSERLVGLEGSPNFRDAGGYASSDGEILSRGNIFRSGHLAQLTDADTQRLAALRLELICDLRREDEQRHEPSIIPAGAELMSAPITPGSQSSAIYADATQLGGVQSMFDFMCDINREFVESQSDNYRAVFGRLLESCATRVLFHCSAGKDRTGFVVAMLQLALGVSQADIEADYLLSRLYYLPEEQIARVRIKYPVDHLSDEALLPMMSADIRYLHSALDAVDRHYPSRDAFLQMALGLGVSERRELRRRFVRSAG